MPTTDPRSISSLIEQLSSTMRRMDSPYHLLDSRYKELQALLMGCPFPMWIKDAALKMVFINKAYELEFGIDVNTYNNQLDSHVWPAHIAAEYECNDRKVVAEMKPINVVEHHVDSSGTERPIIIVKWPLELDGNFLGVAGIALGRAI